MTDFKTWWDKAMSWAAYKELLQHLMEEGKTTGDNQDPEMIAYARLNMHRMKRVEKTFKLEVAVHDAITAASFKKMHWLVITEGWCGDAAQSVPALAEIARLFSDKVELKVILRDEDTTLIDQFLTNGGRSIPILIILDEHFQYLGHWGPRPLEAQTLFTRLKVEQVPFEQVAEQLHTWYAHDRTITLQAELAEKISSFR